MPLHIDRVESEIKILRSESTAAPTGGGSETLGALRGRNALREQLRPIVLEILHDELERMKRKVGAP
ncbi:MAG TPA: hypothetical protein VIU61_00520 [Kofleriaceae bacterium]